MILGQPGAVIAGEQDQGVFVQSQIPERIQHLPHAPVDFLHHVAIQPPQAPAVELRCDKQGDMWEGVGEVLFDTVGLH